MKKKVNYKGFVEHLMKYDEKGIPHRMIDLIRLAKKYNTPIPIGFDKYNHAIFKNYE